MFLLGVYHHVSGEELGGHAVKMVGWGEENGVPYWLIANSWNNDWYVQIHILLHFAYLCYFFMQIIIYLLLIIIFRGDGGFFKIRRGHDECGIESQIVAGIPKL